MRSIALPQNRLLQCRSAGFARKWYKQGEDMISPMGDEDYKELLVQLLAGPVSERRYDQHGQLKDTDEQSVAYAQAHSVLRAGCPAGAYLPPTPGGARMCIGCPKKKVRSVSVCKQGNNNPPTRTDLDLDLDLDLCLVRPPTLCSTVVLL